MKRSWGVWIAFGACLAVVLAAMGWISLKALGLERAEIEARRQAGAARRRALLEQDVQLALYRMEFIATPLVAAESARPFSAYRGFVGVESSMYGSGLSAPLAVSPLVSQDWPDVLLHFQFEPDGRLTAPRVPEPARRSWVVPEHLSQADVDEAERRLACVAEIVDRDRLLAMLPEEDGQPTRVVAPLAQTDRQRALNDMYQETSEQQGRDVAEFSRRSQAVQQSANLALRNTLERGRLDAPLASPQAQGGLMQPFWIDGHLFLARRVQVGEAVYVQGCLLNWPSIEQGLLMAIEDLLPGADLQPVGPGPAAESRRLAALPGRLVPGPRPRPANVPRAEAERSLSPIRLSLLVAWACVLVAAVAVAALVAGVIRLSERRAAFVSAVTHELRTPLTTFHMYTEMLAEGMVPDPEKQQGYLATLRAEAARLSHLVENVLAYARLERGRADGRLQRVSLAGLLDPIHPRLADRARLAGMEVCIERDEDLLATPVRANPSAVEQILANLVDNAGKYAAAGADKRIHLAFRRSDGAIELRVRDHGPGISRPAARRLFRSFSKSAREAADSAPGVGLGLALSRRLARDMGARLWLDRTVTDGACFVLALPIARPSSG